MGWNSILEDNPTGNARQISQQLTYIGALLHDIRRLLAAAMVEEDGDG